jgi:hypothetical protein
MAHHVVVGKIDRCVPARAKQAPKVEAIAAESLVLIEHLGDLPRLTPAVEPRRPQAPITGAGMRAMTDGSTASTTAYGGGGTTVAGGVVAFVADSGIAFSARATKSTAAAAAALFAATRFRSETRCATAQPSSYEAQPVTGESR